MWIYLQNVGIMNTYPNITRKKLPYEHIRPLLLVADDFSYVAYCHGTR